MADLARKVASTPHSAIREMAQLARGIPDAIRLETGDPDFVTPVHIIEAAAKAAREGFTKYTPSAGLSSLRERIAEKVRDRNGIAVSPEQVIVTTGGGGGLFTTFLVLLDPGDEVLVPDPGWPGYPAQIHFLGGVTVRYPLDRGRGFEPDLEALESLVGPRTKVLVVNSPSNPTGAVYGPETLGAMLELARKRDLWVVSDECYDELVFDGAHTSMAALGEQDRVLTVFTFSKSYAMTGWRVGYVVAPGEVAEALAKAQEPVVANCSAVSQKAAEAALLGPQDVVREMREAYRRRRDDATALLDAAGVGYVRPRGAFYLMADISASGEPSIEFAHRLLLEQHVSVVPGIAFGPHGEGSVRVSLSVAPDLLHAGVERLAAAVSRSAAAL